MRIICILILVVAFCFLGQNWAKKEELKKIEGLQIVALGDSIWDINREETGIASLLAMETKAAVYNLGIMGTTASYRGEDALDWEVWNSKSFLNVVNSIVGEEPGLLSEEKERLSLDEIDFGNTDYFFIAFGLNDYFTATPRGDLDLYNEYTYAGALQIGIEKLQSAFPNSKIVILSQTYCQGYSYGKVDTESDWKDWGGGTGPDYVETAQKVANKYNLLFVDNYSKMGINIHNGTSYLSDATHLTEKGRRKYVKILIDALISENKG